MQVMDFLAAFGAGIGHQPKAAFRQGMAAVISRQTRDQLQHAAQPRMISRGDVGQ